MIRKEIQHLGRLREIVTAAAKYGFEDIRSYLGLPGKKLTERVTQVDPELSPYVRIRMLLEELGPTFVKFGQIMSLRSDMLPSGLVQELEKLQNDVSPIPADALRKAIENEITTPLDALFSEIHYEPVAAASISQVHLAVLRENGARVVLKVQRPDIRSRIEKDLAVFAIIAEQVHERTADLQVYDLPGMVALVRRTIRTELDFTSEARYMELARRRLSDLQGMDVPRVYPEISSARLLVMDYIPGHSLRDMDPGSIESPASMAKNGLRTLVRQVLEDGFFHGDPHPGNVIVQDRRILWLVDWGMVGWLTIGDRNKLIDLLAAIVDRDHQQMAATIEGLSEGGSARNRRQLERDVMALLDIHSADAVERMQIGLMLRDISTLMRRHRLRLPPDLFLMIKALITLEGTVRRIHPALDVVSEVTPHVKRLARERFSPARLWRQLWNTLFRLSSAPGRFPRRVGDIVDKMERGELRIGFEHRNLQRFEATIERTFSRLTAGVIVGSMIIGSSLIITTGTPPMMFGYPLIGLLGYLIAAVFGFWIVLGVVRKG